MNTGRLSLPAFKMQICLLRVIQPQTFPYILHTYMSAPRLCPVIQPVKRLLIHAPTVILQQDMQKSILAGHANVQTALSFLPPKSVADAVFHKWLQKKLVNPHILYSL